MSRPPWLLIRNGLTPDWGYELLPGEHRIGRGKLCQVRLQDDSVSREHAMIMVDAGRIALIDLGSRNGTFVGGRKVERANLSVGDNLRFGLIEVEVVRDMREARNRLVENDETTMAGTSRLPNSVQDQIETLTEAQKRVLSLVLRGNSEKQMAALLFISTNTVHNHMRKLYEKFGVQSRPELMAIFIPTP